MRKMFLILTVFAGLIAITSGCGKSPLLASLPEASSGDSNGIDTSTTTSTTRYNDTLSMTVCALSATLQATPSVTMRLGTTPKFKWAYSGVNDDHVYVEVSSGGSLGGGYGGGTTYWISDLGNSTTTNATYGVQMPFAFNMGISVAPKPLIKGSYVVTVYLGSESGYTGKGYGTFTIE